MRVARLSWVAVALTTMGCADRPEVRVGEPCELTTDCQSPFVCRFGACREECREARDCRAGLLCLKDENRFGVCQVPAEGECDHADDCPDGLVCRFATCTTECNSDRDCISGLICDVVGVDQHACRDPTEDECRLNSDCMNPLHVCARDLRCRVECITDRDCRDGRVCDVAAPTPSCVPPSMVTDAGMDATMDASMDATMDATMDAIVDAPMDAVIDAADSGTTVLAVADYTAGGVARNGAYLDGTSFYVWGRTNLGETGIVDTVPNGPALMTVPGGVVTLFGVGGSHMCALTDRVYCWGGNTDGQLGRPATGLTPNPTPMPMTTALTTVRGFALGFAHSCVWTDTRVRCWGSNASGQLGSGSTGPGVYTEVPTDLDLGAAPARVVAGDQHTCAIRGDNQLWCWGRNSSGELGDGSRTDRVSPALAPIGPVVDVSLGRSHTCAVHLDGTLTCFGSNSYGELGLGTLTPNEDPTTVSMIAGPVARVSAGTEHTCALLASGPIQCWGRATGGRLGRPIIEGLRRPSPVTSSLGSGADSVGAGDGFTCAHYGGGVAQCVGSNLYGAFGTGDTADTADVPVMVTWP